MPFDLRIANVRGVPGTLGCVARFNGTRPVLLTAWHALFGRGASWRDVIWLVDDGEGARRYRPIGRTLQGRIGTMRFEGADYFVDCAIGSCAWPDASRASTRPPASPSLPLVAGHDRAETGTIVTKTGAATGTTAGVVVDDAYCGSVLVGGCCQPAPRQLLIRSRGDTPFSAEGDSGAVVVDAMNRAVGLLWGTTARGEGVACHIAPVLRALNITLPAPMPSAAV